MSDDISNLGDEDDSKSDASEPEANASDIAQQPDLVDGVLRDIHFQASIAPLFAIQSHTEAIARQISESFNFATTLGEQKWMRDLSASIRQANVLQAQLLRPLFDQAAIELNLSAIFPDKLQHTFAGIGNQFDPILQNIAEEVNRFQAVINSQLSGIFSDKLQQTIAELLKQLERERPRNWPSGERSRWSEMSSFVQETRWPIVWVPRMEVVERLIAPGVDRDEILISARIFILDDCVEVLDQIAETEITTLVQYAREAIDAARAGAWSPAQAMAAAILTTVLQHHMGFATLSEARTELNINPDEALTGFIRCAFILSCVPWSLAQFYTHNGDPVPTDFNRHASVHHVSAEQYTQRNGLVALIMTVALLREIHEHQVNGTWSQFVNDVETN